MISHHVRIRVVYLCALAEYLAVKEAETIRNQIDTVPVCGGLFGAGRYISLILVGTLKHPPLYISFFLEKRIYYIATDTV